MIIGIEIGGTKLQLVLGDQTGRIVQRLKLAVAPGRGAAGIREQIQKALPKLAGTSPVTGIGVGFGGPVDWKTGRICRSHQIEGWSEFDLGGWLHQLSGAAVRVDNDANVASLGEARCGAGQESNPVFYVTLGSGVGGGLVVDGRIYHGATPGEAEIGHIRLDRQGTIVESRCSGWAVDARLRELKNSQPKSLICQMPGFGKGGEAKYLAAALKQGDVAAQGILQEIAEDMSFGLSHVVHLFHPQVIVLGGGLSRVGEPLRAAVEEALPHFIMGAFAPGPRIALTSLGEDAVPVGALLLSNFSADEKSETKPHNQSQAEDLR
jgi:glucokinase